MKESTCILMFELSSSVTCCIAMLWVDSADDKLMIFFLFFPENRQTSHANCLGKYKQYFKMWSAESFAQHAEVLN